MSARFLWSGAAAVLAMAVACGTTVVPPAELSDASLQHVTTFEDNDDPFDDPGSAKELRAITYAKDYLESLGLQAFIQKVPLVRMIPGPLSLGVQGPAGTTMEVGAHDEHFVLWPGRQEERVTLEAEVVFAGYGIVSPEYHRDDYKLMDVTGKIVLVLEDSPQTGDRSDLGVLGQTYYGTRLYKATEAARRGAAGLLIIQGDPGTPWWEIQSAAAGSIIDLDGRLQDKHRSPRSAVEGWISNNAASRLLALAGHDYATAYRHAREMAFQPVALSGVRIAVDMTNEIRHYTSHDAIGVLPGSTQEYVMLAGRWNRLDPTAWAHAFGPQNAVEGEPTVPSASAVTNANDLPDDDGSGAAVVLEAARRLTTEFPRPRRTIVFMVATALKPGIVGLEHYSEHPPETLPMEQMTALVFLDHGDPLGTSPRVGKIGVNADEALSQVAREAAVEQGRLFELDDHEEKRFYYAFGQTELGRDGVRSLYLTTRPDDDGTARRLRNLARKDRVAGLAPAAMLVPTPSLSKDAALLTTLLLRVANATNWPPRIEAAGTTR